MRRYQLVFYTESVINLKFFENFIKNFYESVNNLSHIFLINGVKHMKKTTMKCVFWGVVITTALVFTSNANAATIHALSCSNTDVQMAITSASSGDTVIVPAGTCTWTTTVSIPSGKAIKLIGAGIDVTTIESTTTRLTVINNDYSRVSGFTFHRTTGTDTAASVIFRGATNFRLDHCKFTNADYATTWTVAVQADAFMSDTYPRPTGVVDNCTIDKMKIVVWGGSNFARHNDFWDDPSVMGTDGTVYFEDNMLDRGDVNSILSDSDYGGSYVIRYNDIYGGNAMVHSIQGTTHRGTKEWEIYGNAWTFPSSAFTNIAFMRAGTGRLFYNTVSGPNSSYTINFDNVRSFQTGCCGDNPPPDTDDPGMCDGTSLWDGNTESNGWPCRDQIGRGPDIGTDSSVIGKATSSSPVYLWGNMETNSDNVPVQVVNGVSAWIQNNRDYYDYDSSFDGTSGTGCGTVGSRPATCTTGVGYWATSQSCSDISDYVGTNPITPISGTLYKCTFTDTWTEHYTPYTYPHPLRGEESSSQGIILPPQNFEPIN